MGTKQHERWTDWMPDGAPPPKWLSRHELLAELQERHGIRLSPASFQHYRRIGLLPRPIRRRYNGFTQAVYPAWLIPVIVHAWQLKEHGKTLDEIRSTLKEWVIASGVASGSAGDEACPHCHGTGLVPKTKKLGAQ